MILFVVGADVGNDSDVFLDRGYIDYERPGQKQGQSGGVQRFALTGISREEFVFFVEEGRRLLPLSPKDRERLRKEGRKGQILALEAEHVFLCRSGKILKIK